MVLPYTMGHNYFALYCTPLISAQNQGVSPNHNALHTSKVSTTPLLILLPSSIWLKGLILFVYLTVPSRNLSEVIIIPYIWETNIFQFEKVMHRILAHFYHIP